MIGIRYEIVRKFFERLARLLAPITIAAYVNLRYHTCKQFADTPEARWRQQNPPSTKRPTMTFMRPWDCDPKLVKNPNHNLMKWNLNVHQGVSQILNFVLT